MRTSRSKDLRVLPTQIDIAAACAGGHCRDGHAFDEHEGIALHEHAIGEGPRIAFICVAHDVLLRALRAQHGFPLDSRGKCRAASASKSGRRDIGDDFVGGQGQGRGQSAVAVVFQVIGQTAGIGDPDAREGQPFLTLEVGYLLGEPQRQGVSLAGQKTRIV